MVIARMRIRPCYCPRLRVLARQPLLPARTNKSFITKREENAKMSELKAVVLGPGGVGKSGTNLDRSAWKVLPSSCV